MKIIGAVFRGEFLDQVWLDKLTAALEGARAKFSRAWEAARTFLGQIGSIVAAVQRISQDVAHLIGLVRQAIRRIFAGSSRLLQPGTIFRDIYELWCPELVVIPPGEFMMGSTEAERQWAVDRGAKREWVDSERPRHLVRIAYHLAVACYPATLAEYEHFCERTRRQPPNDAEWGRSREPVTNVSWHDARAYVEWLAAETGHPYRLLSEAEWEYACRAGTTTRYWWGDEITSENANYAGSRIGKPSEVGRYPANPWGLHDTHGNVWEWVEDVWNGTYQGAPTNGSAWFAGKNSRHVLRGGSWNNEPRSVRSATRFRYDPVDQNGYIGFRVARAFAP